MQSTTRRQWLMSATFATAAATTLGRLEAKSFTRPLGAELYTVRNLMPKSDEATLKQIAQIGYKEVEGDYPTFMRTASMLKADGLNPVSCHIPTPLVTGNWAPWGGDHNPMSKGLTLEKVYDDLKKIGTQYVVLAYLMPNERGDMDAMKKVADQMNEAGKKAKAAGLQFAYHNHAFEWKGEKGQRVIDAFMSHMDPHYANFEIDVFWVSVAGNDPVEVLKMLKGRVPLVHLKDKKQGFATQYTENVPKDTFQEVGNGSLDFAKVIRAAEAAGAKHFFVEQDQTASDPLASLKTSYEHIRALNLA